jgi:hypothetical protein
LGEPGGLLGYLPDAEEGRRETLVTTAVDAVPMQS